MAKGAGLGLLMVVVALVFLSTLLVSVSMEEETHSGEVVGVVFGEGSLHINDAGRSHGGLEYAADYGVEVTQACNGTVLTGHIAGLVFTLEAGLGDALEVHELQLKLSYDEIRDEIVLSDSDTTIRLIKVDVDTIWNHEWDGYYIASWGGDAPDEEIRGEISPEIFGLPDHYYIELRLDATVLFG